MLHSHSLNSFPFQFSQIFSRMVLYSDDSISVKLKLHLVKENEISLQVILSVVHPKSASCQVTTDVRLDHHGCFASPVFRHFVKKANPPRRSIVTLNHFGRGNNFSNAGPHFSSIGFCSEPPLNFYSSFVLVNVHDVISNFSS